MKRSRLAITFSLILIISISACRKNDKEEDNDITFSRDNAEAQSAFSGIWKQLSEVSDSTTQLRLASCATWTLDNYDTVTYPKTLTIDYGTVNCLCSDGVNRRGKIIATYSGKYRNPGTIISITLNNFFHNNNQVQGSQSFTNSGLNTAGNLTYSAIVSNGSITTSLGIISWSSNQTIEWVSGQSTMMNPFDDAYLISGSSSGTGLNGNSFTTSINSPLRTELACRWITSGSFILSPQNYSSMTMDYGSGGCDNSATVTLNASTTTISLY
ncbi:MAG: hypothetical protein M3R27_15975 [Bacteroidota bacterium]|nr:hypothetical protein [Bacteroidota bacterium]